MQGQDQEIFGKQFIIVNVLFLRKLLRSKGQKSRYDIFGRFGIGYLKYEVCSNLSYRQKNYLTIDYNSSTLYEYFPKFRKTETLKCQIESLMPNYTRTAQNDEGCLIISGGYKSNSLSYYYEGLAQKSSLQYDRGMHGVALWKEMMIFVSGYFSQTCELLILQKEAFELKSKQIQRLPTQIAVMGTTLKEETLLTFGGLKDNSCITDIMFTYNIHSDQWLESQQKLPEKSTTMSIYMTGLNSILVYNNINNFLLTHIYDVQSESFQFHGQYYKDNG